MKLKRHKKRQVERPVGLLAKQSSGMTSPVHLPSNLVSQLLRWDDSYLLTYSLVGVEVECETSVVFLDQILGGFLNGLGSNTSLERKQNILKFVKKSGHCGQQRHRFSSTRMAGVVQAIMAPKDVVSCRPRRSGRIGAKNRLEPSFGRID